jgi:hypothetical protein
MRDTPNDHSRGHSRTLVRTTTCILVVAYLTTIPNLMPNRMSLLMYHLGVEGGRYERAILESLRAPATAAVPTLPRWRTAPPSRPRSGSAPRAGPATALRSSSSLSWRRALSPSAAHRTYAALHEHPQPQNLLPSPTTTRPLRTCTARRDEGEVPVRILPYPRADSGREQNAHRGGGGPQDGLR